MPSCRFCGPKLSLLGIVLGAWGAIQLSSMAVSFYMNSVALSEDLGYGAKEWMKLIQDSQGNRTKVVDDMNSRYERQTLNCAIAAGLYALTFFVSLHQYVANSAGHKHNRLHRQANSCQ